MGSDDEDLSEFLKSHGFTDEKLNSVLFELNSLRSIPGTTIRRYTNRIINTIEQDHRPAFLKGILLGVAIRKAADLPEGHDFTDE